MDYINDFQCCASLANLGQIPLGHHVQFFLVNIVEFDLLVFVKDFCTYVHERC